MYSRKEGGREECILERKDLHLPIAAKYVNGKKVMHNINIDYIEKG